jgi:hypothetical protein
MLSSVRIGNFQMPPFRRPAGPYALAILLSWAVGCSQPSSIETAEVSGQVVFNGRPLPGGRLTFVTPDSKFSKTETIDLKGNYKIMAPVGEVLIAVNNSMLLPRKQVPLLKRPGASTPSRVTGTYVRIPSKYYYPETSGLRYTVQSGPQTHTISLQEEKRSPE